MFFEILLNSNFACAISPLPISAQAFTSLSVKGLVLPTRLILTRADLKSPFVIKLESRIRFDALLSPPIKT